MKPIHLTPQEKSLLRPYVIGCQELLVEKEQNPPKYYTNALNAMLEKLSDNLDYGYNDWQQSISCGCIYEQFKSLQAQVPELTSGHVWLTLTDAEKQAMQNVDTAKAILYKFGYYKRVLHGSKPRYYSRGFEALEKLKQSDIIYLSHSGGDYYYKIGFVCNGTELRTFELDRQISPCDIEVQLLRTDPIEYGMLNFSEIVQRTEAHSILSRLNKENYPSGVLSFFQAMLN